MATETKFAIVNGVKTSHKIIAVCEYRSYAVWGNADEGWQVNDLFSEGLIEIEAECHVSNLPRYPGAKDAYRSFPPASGITCEVLVSFELTDKAIRKALGITCQIEIEGDGERYYINRARDGYPIGELEVVEWKDAE